MIRSTKTRPSVHCLWPLASPSAHYQASIFATATSANNAVEAAKALAVRRFEVQVFKTEPRASIDQSALEAARISSRLVVVEGRGASSGLLYSSIVRALKRSNHKIPLVHLESGKFDPGHLMEACLRNLE